MAFPKHLSIVIGLEEARGLPPLSPKFACIMTGPSWVVAAFFLEFESSSLELFGYDLCFCDLRFKPFLLVTTEKPAASM